MALNESDDLVSLAQEHIIERVSNLRIVAAATVCRSSKLYSVYFCTLHRCILSYILYLTIDVPVIQKAVL